MFSGCYGVTELDVSNWDNSKVTNMENMFVSFENLTTLDLSNFDTSNVTSMSTMFQACENLTTLDVSNFDTSNVTSMSTMFQNCKSLTTLDLSNWDVSKCTGSSSLGNYIFAKCGGLTNFKSFKNISANISFSSCTELTHDSLMSIINNLATVTSTKTLTLGATNLAKLTADEVAIATNKGWTVK
jgi:surface protein